MKRALYRTPEYWAWNHMCSRCTNPKASNYAYYGGRGITVCERWLGSYANFLADMGSKPSNKHTLDRWPNNDGNYEPENCRWATMKEQSNNRRQRIDSRKPRPVVCQSNKPLPAA